MKRLWLYVILVWRKLALLLLPAAGVVRLALRRLWLMMKIKYMLSFAKMTDRMRILTGNFTDRKQEMMNRCTYCRPDETLLSAFIRAEKGDYGVLRKSGNPSEDMLKQAFSVLMNGFCELSGNRGNREYRKTVNAYKGLAGAQAKLMKLRMLLQLKNAGKDVEKNIKAITAGKPVEMYIASLTKERDRFFRQIEDTGKEEKGEPMNMEQALTDLSIWLKFNLRAEDITVARFAGYIKSYNEYVEQMKRSNSRHK